MMYVSLLFGVATVFIWLCSRQTEACVQDMSHADGGTFLLGGGWTGVISKGDYVMANAKNTPPDGNAQASESTKLRRTGGKVIDQRQQQKDPAGHTRRDTNAGATKTMKQPGKDRDGPQ